MEAVVCEKSLLLVCQLLFFVCVSLLFDAAYKQQRLIIISSQDSNVTRLEGLSFLGRLIALCEVIGGKRGKLFIMLSIFLYVALCFCQGVD